MFVEFHGFQITVMKKKDIDVDSRQIEDALVCVRCTGRSPMNARFKRCSASWSAQGLHTIGVYEEG